MPHDRRRPLWSWPKLLGAAIYDLYRAIERASEKERQALRAHIDSLTKTNCWWAEYEAAPIVRNALDRFEARLYAEKKLTMICRTCHHAPADHSLLAPYPCTVCDCGGWK